MDRRWLLDWIGRGVEWAFTFRNSDGVRYFHQAWLGRAIRKRPAAAGLFFGFGDGRSTTTVFIISDSLFQGQMVRRGVTVADRKEGLSLPRESLQYKGGPVGAGPGATTQVLLGWSEETTGRLEGPDSEARIGVLRN
jgi:hypothetical protein